MSKPIVRILTNEYRNNQVRCRHENAAPEQQWTPAESIHCPEAAAYANELHIIKICIYQDQSSMLA